MKLRFVKALQKGKTKAPDMPKIQAVDDKIVDATLTHLPQVVADMVVIQKTTGMRPGEVFSMTWEQIDTSDDIWIYMPQTHKTQHHGIVRPVPLNAKCQKVLARYRDTPIDAIIFSPRRTLREQAEKMAAQRKTKVQPSQIKRKKQALSPEELVGEAYNRHSYRNCIQRACKRAGVENWCPYQLRHSAATSVSDKLSLEDAKTLLGHTNIITTKIYVHESIEKVKEVARRMEG
jgi:integrase